MDCCYRLNQKDSELSTTLTSDAVQAASSSSCHHVSPHLGEEDGEVLLNCELGGTVAPLSYFFRYFVRANKQITNTTLI